MDMQDIKLDLIKANIVAKKRKEDLAILLIDTSGMDDDVKAWYEEGASVARGGEALDMELDKTTHGRAGGAGGMRGRDVTVGRPVRSRPNITLACRPWRPTAPRIHP
ncbi:hypothetical protein QYE76_067071 [Lolium multiflorum]|uniref:Uncharacterized protein n=1 Tax=Lolium multiflorum TaxID=4521 RepID=A0AAD8SBQ0_LOLMU|nr:hypothetical protein QYE76_067071 [Lolium multiflorum]